MYGGGSAKPRRGAENSALVCGREAAEGLPPHTPSKSQIRSLVYFSFLLLSLLFIQIRWSCTDGVKISFVSFEELRSPSTAHIEGEIPVEWE